MAEATMADGAVEKSSGWRCAGCGQRWDAARLATVGAYAAWLAEHDARFVDRKIKNFDEAKFMRNCGFIGVCALTLALYVTALAAQDLGRYREFELGSEVAAVSHVTGIALSDVKVVHHRPALIQELTWRPGYGTRRPAVPDTESVERIVFGFYDDRLFQVAVDYDRERTKGLTDADMIEAISSIYGRQVKPTVSRNRQTLLMYEDILGAPIAQWGNVDHSVRLYRPYSYATIFKLVVTAEPMAALARTAAARAVQLDAQEAPQREAAREKQESENRRAAEEKARLTNKPVFRP